MLSVELAIERAQFVVRGAFGVAPGEITVIAGPSGAGKTTIVRSLAGLLRPDSGSIRCGDHVWFHRERGRRPRIDLRPRDRRIGMVVQEGALFPHLSAWRNVAFGAEGSAAERRVRATQALAMLGLAGRIDDRPDSLSGGERQRVALARALGRSPTALIMDEPFSALDADTRARAIEAVVDAVARWQIPAVVVSHDERDASRLGARILHMAGGTLGPAGTARPGDDHSDRSEGARAAANRRQATFATRCHGGLDK